MCSSPYISFFTTSKSLLSIVINKDNSEGCFSWFLGIMVQTDEILPKLKS